MSSDFDPDEWAALSSLLDEVLKLPIDERPAWLESLRARNPGQHASLLRLLAADAGAADAAFLESPAAVRAINDEAPGFGSDVTSGDGGETEGIDEAISASAQPIGPYRLLQKVGEGGMGEVWLAEQTAPIKRRVALKLIKVGMDTRQVIARFEAERQALAVMDHPAIAKVFDAGETTTGRPYFVMEYVKGEPITSYCDRRRSTTIERIALFRQVCEGVQHAHQKGIIHRDLKPSNILVETRDDKALPRIIDFGVAKATAQRLTEKTLVTELGAMIGTPEYMSPEQAELTGLDVDTRTDVYSLGVVLYELLVGALPFDTRELRRAAFDEVRRVIREVDPPRPSVRVSSPGVATSVRARNRKTDPGRLAGQLRGDLDWITMKALEKDRTRRYGSPSELAADLARHLDNLPVLAGPPSVTYRARKFVRRHRVGVAMAALVGAALILATVGTAVGLVRARRAEEAARSEKTRAEKVAKFLSGMLEDVDPISMGKALSTEIVGQLGASPLEGFNTVDAARQLMDAEILQKAATRVQAELGDDPALAAELYHTIGTAEHSLQLYEPARELFTRAIELSTRTHGADDPFTLGLQSDLADVDKHTGRYGEAEAVYRQVVAIARRTRGEEARETLSAMNYLGDTYRYEGRDAEAESMLRETLEKTRRVLGEDDMETLEVRNNLANVLRDERRYAEAEALLRETTDKMKRVAKDPGEPLNTAMNLANVLRLSGRPDEAEKLLLELHASSGRVLGEDALITLMIRRILGDVYRAQKRNDEAEPLMRDTLLRMRRALGPENPETLIQIHALAGLLMTRGKMSEAEPLLLETLPGYKRAFGERHFRTFRAANDLGTLYQEQGRRAEAERCFLDVAHALEGAHPVPLDAIYGEAAFHLACLAASRNDRSDAMTWLRKAVDAGLVMPERITTSPDLARLRGPELDALAERARVK